MRKNFFILFLFCNTHYISLFPDKIRSFVNTIYCIPSIVRSFLMMHNVESTHACLYNYTTIFIFILLYNTFLLKLKKQIMYSLCTYCINHQNVFFLYTRRCKVTCTWKKSEFVRKHCYVYIFFFLFMKFN